MIDDESLHLYHLTLRSPSAAVRAVAGSFSGAKKIEEIVLVSSTSIDVYTHNPSTDKLDRVAHQKLLGVVQAVEVLRNTGSQDLLVLTSDSGNLTICQYNNDQHQFLPVCQQGFGKNGMRRTQPGEYIAVDPQNRAILVLAVDRNKLMFKISTGSPIEMSSPLEASARALTLMTSGLDTAFDSPMFACVEIEEGKPGTVLAWYELDQGLNHVVRRRSNIPVRAPTHLVPLPQPVGGVVVCCENYAIWTHPDPATEPVWFSFPRREGEPTSIVASVIHKLKKGRFFVLLQSSLGDLFKLTVSADPTVISIKYFDTIEPGSSLAILRSGYVFASGSRHDHKLYQFEDLGEGPGDVESTVGVEITVDGPVFPPRDLKHLAPVDSVDSLAAAVDAHLVPGRASTQLLALAGRSMKLLVHGMPTTTVVSSPAPEMVPTAVFTTKKFALSTNDEFIVLSSSLASKTIVLSIGEEIEVSTDSKFELNQPTIAVQQVGRRSIVQVHSYGVRHVRWTRQEATETEESKDTSFSSDWHTPAGISIVHASANDRQIVIGLLNREIHYFEIDPVDDELQEYSDTFEVSDSITAVAVDAVASQYFVLSTADEMIQVVSLQHLNMFEVLSVQAILAAASALAVAAARVHIGMVLGVYASSSVDVGGRLHDTRAKYLGPAPVHLARLALLLGSSAVLAVSARPWLAYSVQKDDANFKVTPLLDVDVLDGALFFSDELGGHGIVGISEGNLVIFTLGSDDDDSVGSVDDFAVSAAQLQLAPRKMVVDDKRAYVLEAQLDPGSKWTSSVESMDLSLLELESSHEVPGRAVSLCSVQFAHKKYLAVGATDGGSAHWIYVFAAGSSKLTLVHRTQLDQVPAALAPFDGKLLVGSRNQLRVYDLGQKQLLRKSWTTIDHLSSIVQLIVHGNFVITGDLRNSTTLLEFDPVQNQFVAVCDDIMQRHVTSLVSLDPSTVMGGDKFGSVFVSRLPRDVRQRLQNDITLKFHDSYLNASASRWKTMCEFQIHDTPTAFCKGSLVTNGVESVFYIGIQGTVGVLMPILTKQEIELLQKLELKLRETFTPYFEEFNGDVHGVNVLGKDHLKFRSYYNPVKNVVDGDLLEKFYELKPAIKIKIANELDRTPKEIERKLFDLRNRTAF